ncbi:hypothetical protein [Gemmata obscuriglobus]|uniref:hypothetical protein n=1 Tax=Gemmata obscuriglobus TaxID=114 RepID=UPI0002D5B68B|nr:hypothetical protein [Gemmata obscuriglobus]
MPEKELDALTAQFASLGLMPYDYFWKSLLTGRRSGDEVRRVTSTDGRACFVLVRGDRLLDTFLGPEPSHAQQWLALKANQGSSNAVRSARNQVPNPALHLTPPSAL